MVINRTPAIPAVVVIYPGGHFYLRISRRLVERGQKFSKRVEKLIECQGRREHLDPSPVLVLPGVVKQSRVVCEQIAPHHAPHAVVPPSHQDGEKLDLPKTYWRHPAISAVDGG